MKKAIKIPKFKSADEESQFWKKLDLAKHFEPSDFKRVSFPNLKPSTKTISIRLPEGMLDRLKILANKRDVPYQSYIKIILDDKIESEMRK
jgi:predicted DNA binding CopG/RHH family protein